jgi:Arc/MetJ-type ribon-helix-helix transcriptional regulator
MAEIELLQKDKPKIYVTMDGFTIDKINELLLTRDFKSVSALVRKAIVNLYKDYEVQGKLKPTPAEEIAKEIEQKKHKPIKETDAGEEVIR